MLIAAPASADKNEWLPIAPEDLALKDNPVSPGSHAMVLYSETVHDLEKRFTSYYVRTKIFDQDGMKYAHVEGRLGGPTDVVEDFHARSIHPDGSVVDFAGEPVRETRLGFGRRYTVEVFSFLGVTPGSIIEYRYRSRSHPEKAPSRTVYTSRLPGDLSQFLTQSIYFDWPVRGELFTREARFIIHPAIRAGMPSGGADYRPDNLPAGTVVTVKEGRLLCDAADVPALPPLDYPPPQREIQGRIEMHFRAHRPETESQFWGPYAQISRDVEQQFLSSDKLARRIAGEILQPGDTPETTLRKLYARAQAIRNLSFESRPAEEEAEYRSQEPFENVDDVFKHGSGHSSDINMAFLALARAAHFEADSVLLSSRDIQSLDLHRFDFRQLNTSVVWVRLPDADVILDPGTPLCPYGMLPWQKSLTGGLRLTKEGWTGLHTPALRPQDSRIERSAVLQLSPDGRLLGTMQVRLFGQEALELRLQNLGLSEEERASHLSARIREWLPGDVTIERLAASGWDSGEGPLSAQLQISVPAVPGPEDGISVPLFVTVVGQRNLFESSLRDYPVQFKYPYQELDEIRVTLPSGMTWGQPLPRQKFTFDVPGMRVSPPVDSGNAPLRRRTPGELVGAAFESSSALRDNSVWIKRALLVAVDVVQPDKYSKLREFFIGVSAADAEKTVLRPAAAAPS